MIICVEPNCNEGCPFVCFEFLLEFEHTNMPIENVFANKIEPNNTRMWKWSQQECMWSFFVES